MDFNDLNTLNSTFSPFNRIWKICNISKSLNIPTLARSMCRWIGSYCHSTKCMEQENNRWKCKEVKNRLKSGFVALVHFMVQRPHCHTKLIQCGQYNNRWWYTVPIDNCPRKEEILVIIGSLLKDDGVAMPSSSGLFKIWKQWIETNPWTIL